MKKSLLFTLTMFFAFFTFANDTYFFRSGGNLIPTNEKDTNIQMRSEVITFTLEEKYYKINVDFDFYNDGDEVTLSIGFPFFQVGIGGHGKIYDFECWTNGVKTDYSDEPITQDWSIYVLDENKLENAYVRDITFPANSLTKTRVSYKSDYGLETDGYLANYLYGTGSTWQNSIGQITIKVINNSPYDYPKEISMGGSSAYNGKSILKNFNRISDNEYEAVFYEVEPKYTDIIQILNSDILNDVGPKSFPAYFNYNKKSLNKNLLMWYTKAQLRLIRNTIYALHGYNFKSPDLKEFFSKRGKYWYPEYEINPNFTEDDLSQVEKDNIRLLLEEEKKR